MYNIMMLYYCEGVEQLVVRTCIHGVKFLSKHLVSITQIHVPLVNTQPTQNVF